MNLLSATALACVALLFGGCRTPDPTVELLETELRWMEDQLYLLDDQLNQSCAQLASCRNNNAQLRKELKLAREEPDDADEGTDDAGDDASSDEDLFDMTPPVIEQGEPDEADQPTPEEAMPDAITVPPVIEMPEEVDQNGSLGPSEERDPFSAENRPARFEKVAQVALNQQLTGGYDFDGKPGDEGVMVVVEPQDARGQYVPIAGGVTVSVTESGRSGFDSRVAKWEFDEAETAGLLKKTLLGRGIHLVLPWPAEPPREKQLQVEVTYSTIDGRELRARRDVNVDLVGTPTAIASQPAHVQPWTASRATPGSRARHSKTDGISVADRPIWKPQR